MAAPRDTWPCGRGFQRWYGFHGGETHQFVPDAVPGQPRGAAAARTDGRLPPQRGPRRPRDPVPRRPALGRAASSRSSSTSRPAPATRRTTRPPSGSSGTAASSTRVGTRGATRPSPASRRWACCPPGTALSPRPPWVPAWDDLEPEDQRVAARFMECFAGFLSHADEQIGRVLDVRRGARRARQHARRRSSPTTAPAPRAARAARSTTPACGTACPAGRTRAARAHRRARRRRPRTTTTRGAGRWRATRRSGAGSARCTKAASPTRASCTGRAASPAAARSATSSRTRSTCCPTVLELIGDRRRRPRSPASRRRPIEGTSFAYLLDDADAPERHTTQYFEMLGSRGIYHEGWKAVTFKPLGRDVRRRARPRRAVRRRRVGAVPRRRRPLRVRRPRRDAARASSRSWSTCGGRRRARYQVLPLDNRPLAALLAPRRPVRRPRPRYVFWPERRVGARDGHRERAQPHHTITARRRGARAAPRPRACCSRWARRSAGGRSTCSTGGCATCTTTSARTRHVVDVRRRVWPPARTSSRSSFDDRRRLQRRPGALLVDGDVVGEGEIADFTPVRYSITGGGLTCG